MTARLVEFVDTSILLELLQVPGHCGAAVDVKAMITAKVEAGTTLILPTAAVIETGNHICQEANGYHRRRCADYFARLLEMSAAGEAPWTLNEVIWDGGLLERLRTGAGTEMDLVEHAVRQTLGTGDLSVLAERDIYRSRVATQLVDVGIWTLDGKLESYGNAY